MSDKLTTQAFWEGYYSKDHTNKQHIINVCSHYDVFWKKLIREQSKGKTIVEIGGYPGRYLAYLSSKFDLEPTCLDYNSDVSQIENSFKIMEIKNFNILQADFTNYKPKQQYDFVISNGFIEHFDEFKMIMDLHLEYLKPNGKMLIMIPNMKGYIGFYKYLVDYNNLKMHNLKCMNLKVFKEFAKRNQLKMNVLTYFGDFPHNVHQKSNLFQKIIVKGHRFVFKNRANRLVNRYPSSCFSSNIVAIFEKNNSI